VNKKVQEIMMTETSERGGISEYRNITLALRFTGNPFHERVSAEKPVSKLTVTRKVLPIFKQ
jgi:hypothetical protein